MALESYVSRRQDPVTKAIYLEVCVSKEDADRVDVDPKDRRYLNECFAVGANASQWLMGFALIFSRMKEKHIRHGA